MMPKIAMPLFGRFISQMGDWLFYIVASQRVYTQSQSALAVGALAIARMIPPVVLGPVSAPFVRRCNPWKLMALFDVIRGLVVVVAVVSMSAPTILVVSLLLAALESVYSLAYRTAIPTLVDPNDLLKVNALRRSLGNVSLTVGPAVAGAIVAVLGPRVGLLIGCVTFWVCGAAMLAVAIRHRDMDEADKTTGEVPEKSKSLFSGFRVVFKEPTLRSFMCSLAVAGIGYGCFNYLIVYANEILAGGEASFGVMTSAMGIGGIVSLGALLFPAGRIDPWSLYGVAASADGACLAVLALGKLKVVGTAVVLFLSGSNDNLAGASSETILQTHAPKDSSTHVFAVEAALSRISSLVGVYVFGKLIDIVGVRTSFGVAACFLLFAGSMAWYVRHISAIRKRLECTDDCN